MVVIIMLFGILITLCLTGIQTFIEYKKEVNIIHSKIEEIKKYHVPSIAANLWDYDEKSLVLQAQSIKLYNDIEFVQISHNTEVIVSAGTKDNNLIMTSIPLSINYKGEQKQIGKLILGTNLENIYAKLKVIIGKILFIVLIIISFVSMFFLVVFHYTVTQHLEKIKTHLTHLNIEKIPIELKLNRRTSSVKDELDEIVDSANTMAKNLYESYENKNRELELRIQAEKNLKIAFDGLEERVKERTIKLENALSEIKTLRGIFPICSSCKKIRDDKGYWNQIEVYIQKHSDAEFSHGICPECSDKIYGKEDWYIEMKKEDEQKK